MAPLSLDATGLEGARAALAEPARGGFGAAPALGCAFLAAAAATVLCAVVLLGATDSPPWEGTATGVRAPLAR